MRELLALAIGSALLIGSLPAAAQRAVGPGAIAPPETAAPGIAADLNEQIARVPVTVALSNGQPHTGTMVVTHFRPAGPGPFPVVVFSHGRGVDRGETARWRALLLVRYLTRRGFAVLVPTRIGYGELGQVVDPEAAGPCARAEYRPALANITAQIDGAVGFARTLPWVDGNRVVLAGVSYGGFGTLAAGAHSIPGVIGAINFVGGMGGSPKTRPGEPCQGTAIATIAAELGAKSRVPTLWLYADNDAFWGREWPRRWFDAYAAAGGNARFASFAEVEDDGHRLLSRGFQLWRPVVDRFIGSLGFKVPMATSPLPASGFAEIGDVEKVPHVNAAARDGYKRFLTADVPRAFALAPTGAWGWRTGPDAVQAALTGCQQGARSTCRLYAIDDRVVWKQSQ
jgi:dienelactone hydrolase